MVRYELVLLLLLSSVAVSAQPHPDFPGAQWIGAITRADARLPEGRIYTGQVLKDSLVKAAWAAVDTLSRRSILLGKTVRTSKQIKRAAINICGLGFYRLDINGRKVGGSEFAPLWSDYDKTVYYNTYDVTALFKKGDNIFRVLLGNGFFNEQGGRYHKMKISFGAPTLLFHLSIEYADGTGQQVVSDGSWRYSLSNITFNSIYGGEDYDARIQPQWRPVVVQEAPKGVLRRQIALPVKVMETYGVRSRRNLSPAEVVEASKSAKHEIPQGTFVLDMGQNLSGFPRITVRGRRGQSVRMYVSETLTKEGACDQRQTGRPHYYTYTLGGGGRETWHPHFSYYGFRYIQVEGAVMAGDPNPGGLPVILDIHSCFVYNSAPKTGSFECSNQLFNDTYRIIDRAVRSNMQSVFTDCPHREKLGWLEQNWLNGEGLIYNYDIRAFLEQEMQNIVDAQYPDGAVPTTAPEYAVFTGDWAKPFVESPEWGGAIVALPFLYHSYYGDDTLIRRYYRPMARYVDYLATQDSAYILKQGLGDWYDYGDFRAGFSRNTPVPLVSTAHYYLWTRMMADAARMLHEESDAARFGARADSIREAFNRQFYDAAACQYGTGSQTANAIALEMELVAPGNRRAVLDNLVADIHRHGDRLTTGDVGNRYLFNVLDKSEHRDLLYKMLNHDDVPGYGFQLRKGMTTLTEQWNPEMGSSMNHFMMGQINNLFISSWAGIRISGRQITIAPRPIGDLTWCRGSAQCVWGHVSSSWSIAEGVFRLEVDIPQGATAIVKMPCGGEEKVAAGGKHVFESSYKPHCTVGP